MSNSWVQLNQFQHLHEIFLYFKLYRAKLHVFVPRSFIKFDKAPTKFYEARTKPYHGLIWLNHKPYHGLIVFTFTVKRLSASTDELVREVGVALEGRVLDGALVLELDMAQGSGVGIPLPRRCVAHEAAARKCHFAVGEAALAQNLEVVEKAQRGRKCLQKEELGGAAGPFLLAHPAGMAVIDPKKLWDKRQAHCLRVSDTLLFCPCRSSGIFTPSNNTGISNAISTINGTPNVQNA